MMWILGLAVLAALGGVIGFHMVRPQVRDLRISMAHLLPQPPASQSRRAVFSLWALVASPLFWLRFGLIGLVALALWPVTYAGTGPAKAHVRIVLDITASMAVPDGPQTRFEQARALAAAALTGMSGRDGVCIDLVTVGAETTLQAGAETVLAALEPASAGRGVPALLAAISLEGQLPCGGLPGQVVVITDQPPQAVTQAEFAGRMIWQQVGAPADNLAITGVDLRAGGLKGGAPRLDLLVMGYGAEPAEVIAELDGPGGRSALPLQRDPGRPGGWRASLPWDGAGRYALRLRDGGALAIDDRVVFDPGDLARVAVDWQVQDLPRPPALAPAAGTVGDVLVAPYEGPDAPLPEGPFVLTYPGWPGVPNARIGPFVGQHPILSGVNLDVFEPNAPRPLTLPTGTSLTSVIRPDGSDGTWIALRDAPRGAIVPMPQTGRDDAVSALSRLILFNALAWVAEGAGTQEPVLTYLTKAGDPVPAATAESNTARPLAPRQDLALLQDAGPGMTASGASLAAPAAPWLLLFALGVLLAERVLGLVWRRAGES